MVDMIAGMLTKYPIVTLNPVFPSDSTAALPVARSFRNVAFAQL
jgi:hypothetical protein